MIKIESEPFPATVEVVCSTNQLYITVGDKITVLCQNQTSKTVTFSNSTTALIVNAGFNTWLATLPLDDWSDSYANAIPIHWDEETGEWIEDRKNST